MLFGSLNDMPFAVPLLLGRHSFLPWNDRSSPHKSKHCFYKYISHEIISHNNIVYLHMPVWGWDWFRNFEFSFTFRYFGQYICLIFQCSAWCNETKCTHTHTLKSEGTQAWLNHILCKLIDYHPNLMWVVSITLAQASDRNNDKTLNFDERKAIDFYLFKLCIFKTFICQNKINCYFIRVCVCVLVLFAKFMLIEHKYIELDCPYTLYFIITVAKMQIYCIFKQKFSVCLAYKANDPKISNYCNVSIYSAQTVYLFQRRPV